jgi:UDP-glucose 4-epimerase
MKRILVTGGAGNVGGALARALIKDPGNDVTIVDNLVTSSLGKLPSRDQGTYEFINADVNDYQDIASVMTSTKFDYVFHYAALV